MSGLVDFLRARLDEDERRARSGYYSDTHWQMWTAGAHLGAWRAWRQYFPREQWDVKANDAIADATRDALRERITAHEADRSARVLAEVQAKRQILIAFEAAFTADVRGAVGVGAQDGLISGLTEAVKQLASVYADHPDYREEWKP